MTAREIPLAPLAVTLGLRIESAADGRAVLTGVPDEAHLHPFGAVHGGYALTLLDTAMAVAILTLLPDGTFPSTLELSTNFTRALRPGDAVRATGTVRHHGRSTATAVADLHDDEGRLCAHASSVCLLIQAP